MKNWITYGFDKLIADMPAPEKAEKEISLSFTKGGYNGCQIASKSDVDGKIALRTVSDGGAEITLYSMHRTHEIPVKNENDEVVGAHLHTDVIIPYSGEVLDIKAGITLPFYIDIKAKEAGDFTAAFELVSGENVVDTFKVNMHVWSFALPEEKSFATAVYTADSFISKFDPDLKGEAYKVYYDLLLEHGLSSYHLPYDILDPRADAYMSDPRVTSFAVYISWDTGDIVEEELRAKCEKLKSDPVWLKKAMFYPIDEPREPEHLVQYHEYCARLSAICPEIALVSPFYTNLQTGEGKDQVDDMARSANCWCPKLCLWDDSEAYAPFLDYTPEKSFWTRMDEYKAKGDTMWCYVCNEPIMPYAQLFIDTPGRVHKGMFWQMYQRDIDGFLYWGTNYWGYWAGDVDPWENVCNGVGDGRGKPVYGEGFLLYPGTRLGIPGPVPTTRLKTIRDAVDDLELFNEAGKVLGRDWVKKKLGEATPSLTEYADDCSFARVRTEIGNALEAALSDK